MASPIKRAQSFYFFLTVYIWPSFFPLYRGTASTKTGPKTLPLNTTQVSEQKLQVLLAITRGRPKQGPTSGVPSIGSRYKRIQKILVKNRLPTVYTYVSYSYTQPTGGETSIKATSQQFLSISNISCHEV